MITIEDVRNPKRKSGFDHVSSASPSRIKNPKDQTTPIWRGQSGGWKSGVQFSGWRGPSRRSAAEAAQDYCDHINGLSVPLAPKPEPQEPKATLNLKRTNLKGPCAPKREMSAIEREARKILREEAEKNPSKRLHNPIVYLVGVKGSGDAVKIGHADYNVYSRLKSLQTGNPAELVLLATIECPDADSAKPTEYALHAEFEADNVLNEWFEPSAEMLAAFDLTQIDFDTALGLRVYESETA